MIFAEKCQKMPKIAPKPAKNAPFTTKNDYFSNKNDHTNVFFHQKRQFKTFLDREKFLVLSLGLEVSFSMGRKMMR